MGTGEPPERSASDVQARAAFDRPLSKKNTGKRRAKKPPAAARQDINPSSSFYYTPTAATRSSFCFATTPHTHYNSLSATTPLLNTNAIYFASVNGPEALSDASSAHHQPLEVSPPQFAQIQCNYSSPPVAHSLAYYH